MNNFLRNARAVICSWRFLLNLAVILLITSWIPLLSRTIVMQDEDGTVIHESTISVRIYESWWAVVRGRPALSEHLRAVALHAGLCFSISFGVWYLTLRGPRRQAGSPEESENNPSS